METGRSLRTGEHPDQLDRIPVQRVEVDRVRRRPDGHRQSVKQRTPRVRNCDSVADPGAEHGFAPLHGAVDFVGLIRHTRVNSQDFAELVQDVTLVA